MVLYPIRVGFLNECVGINVAPTWFPTRRMVIFAQPRPIDARAVLIPYTTHCWDAHNNYRVPDAPRVGTGAVWMLGGGARAVLVPYTTLGYEILSWRSE